MRTQWQFVEGGRVAFKYEAALPIATRRGYDLDLFLSLMGAIEYAELKHDYEEREQRRQAERHGRR